MIELKENNNSYLNAEKIEFRTYQKVIAEKCVNRNSLVVLPTGLGKTIIAVLVAAKTLEIFPKDSKIIVLAPTRPLIDQHYHSFIEFLHIPKEKYCVLTGKTSPEKRTDLFKESQILFYTPQTLRNDLVTRKYSLEKVCLVVFDEAHHASGDYPYTLIAEEYVDQCEDGTILALTASPGASKKRITKLCDNLHVPIDNVHVRVRKDEDVKQYLQPMDIFKIGVNLTGLMDEIYSAIQIIVEERLQYLSQLGFLTEKSDILYKKVIRKDLLQLNKDLTGIIGGDGDKTGAYTSISVNAQALILYHMLELIEQQGLDVLLDYLEKLYKDSKKKSSSKAIKMLANDHRLKKIYIELKKNQEYSPENLVHPKYQVLEKILLDELNKSPESRILVFVKLRTSVRNIVLRLKENETIKCKRFVGQTTKSKQDKGLSQKEQIEILDYFKSGKYNVLVSTNVGEEGLDIAECDLVVFYDVVASETRLIQRKGRTARRRKGRVIILYCKNTHDEIYLRIALSKLKKMNVNLRNTKQLKNYYEQQNGVGANQEQEIINKIREFKDTKIKKQSNLQHYIEGKDKEQSIGNKKIEKIKKEIILSNSCAPKFGLRKKFENEKINFSIERTSKHILIYQRVLIQIYEPKQVLASDFKSSIEGDLKDLDLIINIVDFIDFEESYQGEKRLLKKRIQEYSVSHKLQMIPIDNPEELFFIVKNVYENIKKEKT